MRKERNVKFNSYRCLMVALICITLFLIFLVSGLYARFYTSSNESAAAKAAQFNVTISDEQLVEFSKDLSIVMNPQSAPKTYSFTITNASEVAVALNATLKTDGNLPLLYTYRIGSAAEETELSPDADGNIGFGDTLSVNGSSSPTTYTISVKWNPACKSFAYASGVEFLRLSLRVEQIKKEAAE